MGPTQSEIAKVGEKSDKEEIPAKPYVEENSK